MGQVVERLEKADLTIVAMKMISMSKAQAKGFYKVHEGKPSLVVEPLPIAASPVRIGRDQDVIESMASFLLRALLEALRQALGTALAFLLARALAVSLKIGRQR